MEAKYVQYEQAGEVVKVTVNRPERLNAISRRVYAELDEAFTREALQGCADGNFAHLQPLRPVRDGKSIVGLEHARADRFAEVAVSGLLLGGGRRQARGGFLPVRKKRFLFSHF